MGSGGMKEAVMPLLATDFGTYLKENIPLVVIMAIIAAAIVALIVVLCVVRKKQRAETAEEAPKEAEETAPSADSEEPSGEPGETEPPKEPEEPSGEGVPIEPPKEEASANTEEKEPPERDGKEDTMKPEKKPTPKPAAKEPQKEPKKVPAAPVKPEKKSGAAGKWIVYAEDRGGYGFRLLASNGELMLRSSSPYSSAASAKNGIKTYQENIAAGRLEIVETKKGNFFVQVNNGQNRLLATSADYKTRASCEAAAESIKRWAATGVVLLEEDDPS